jgi:hypothetical protein
VFGATNEQPGLDQSPKKTRVLNIYGGSMSPTMLRQLWSVVENSQATTLVSLDDATLVQWLIKQLKTRSSLNCKEADLVNEYIQSRLSLIRDLAQERLGMEPSGSA